MTAAELEVARRVCSEEELKALVVRDELERRGRPAGYRSVADVLGVGWTTARDRIKRAEARVKRANGEAR